MDPAHRTHLVVEAMRRAFRDRTFFLGDPDFVQIPQKVLTSRDYAEVTAGATPAVSPAAATTLTEVSPAPSPG